MVGGLLISNLEFLTRAISSAVGRDYWAEKKLLEHHWKWILRIALGDLKAIYLLCYSGALS